MPHKLGQVFLKDKNAISKILSFADLSDTDTVVEIGCGDGDLSEDLAKSVKNLIIIELDERCIEVTKERLSDCSNVTYIHEDVLKVDLSEIVSVPVKIVANIPYYISAKIVKWIIKYYKQVDFAQLMFQKEFGQKLIAVPSTKAYTSLTVYSQYFLDISHKYHVAKTCFKPVPKVDSSVLHLSPRQDIEAIEESFFDMVRAGFHNRRKLFLNTLKKNPYIKFDLKLSEASLFVSNPNVRAETLSIKELKALYQEIKQFIIKS
ncbi:ribosomal RNA small subunit methyltransferase A [Candidatus Marinamargulisbacteria bacterium SCGC AAA071-K20]|nr:ribosomal RNA small subunit methyltransferase A [Candidatus Marinamargulisbacteria bacterium SCGC AAA071-K20]